MIDSCDTWLAMLSSPKGKGHGAQVMPVDSASPQTAKNLVNVGDCSCSDLRTLQEDIERASTMTAAVIQQTHEQVEVVKEGVLHNRHQVTKIRGYLTTHCVPKPT